MCRPRQADLPPPKGEDFFEGQNESATTLKATLIQTFSLREKEFSAENVARKKKELVSRVQRLTNSK